MHRLRGGSGHVNRERADTRWQWQWEQGTRRLRGGSGNGNRERAAYEMGVAMGTGTVEVYASVYHSTEQEWISAEVVMSPQSTTVMFLKVVAVVT